MGVDSSNDSVLESGRIRDTDPEGFGFSRIGEKSSRASRRRSYKPLGKDALFSVADPDTGVRVSGADVADAIGLGREALFRFRRRSIGVAKVQCRSCGRSSRISWIQLALARFPVSLWFPFRRYDHFMRCPACKKLAWTSVSFFG